MGACCCKDSSGKVMDCRYSTGAGCGTSYESVLGGWICTFYENYPCNEVCFSASEPTIPVPTTNPNSTPTISPPPTPVNPPANPPAVNPNTSPNQPSTNEPWTTDCTINRLPWANCLNNMDVGTNPLSTTPPLDACRKKLQKIVQLWLKTKCKLKDIMCYFAENGQFPPGMEGPVPDQFGQQAAYRCYCDVENEFLRGLENIVTRFCSQQPAMSCKEVDAALKRLCQQYSAAKLACKQLHPNYPSLIPNTPNAYYCGM